MAINVPVELILRPWPTLTTPNCSVVAFGNLSLVVCWLTYSFASDNALLLKFWAALTAPLIVLDVSVSLSVPIKLFLISLLQVSNCPKVIKLVGISVFLA